MLHIFMLHIFRFFTALVFVCTVSVAYAQPNLRIYFLDMAGGASTLVVSPTSESILIDTGSMEPEHRDADRIMAAVEDAGLAKIDHLITTHFHSDHFGGLLEVAKRIPIGKFYDKGDLPEERTTDWFQKLYPRYLEATRGEVQTLATGDELVLDGETIGPDVVLRVVAAEKIIQGSSANVDEPAEGMALRDADHSDNARSIALMLRYGDFDFFAGGDITWNVEAYLARSGAVGPVDLYQITHHGLDQSNNPDLLAVLDPVVSVAMNGPKKGIGPNTFAGLQGLPSFGAVYALNYNTTNGEAGNPPPEHVANAAGSPGGAYVKVQVYPDQGFFEVSVGKNGPGSRYPIR